MSGLPPPLENLFAQLGAAAQPNGDRRQQPFHFHFGVQAARSEQYEKEQRARGFVDGFLTTKPTYASSMTKLRAIAPRAADEVDAWTGKEECTVHGSAPFFTVEQDVTVTVTLSEAMRQHPTHADKWPVDAVLRAFGWHPALGAYAKYLARVRAFRSPVFASRERQLQLLRLDGVWETAPDLMNAMVMSHPLVPFDERDEAFIVELMRMVPAQEHLLHVWRNLRCGGSFHDRKETPHAWQKLVDTLASVFRREDERMEALEVVLDNCVVPVPTPLAHTLFSHGNQPSVLKRLQRHTHALEERATRDLLERERWTGTQVTKDTEPADIPKDQATCTLCHERARCVVAVPCGCVTSCLQCHKATPSCSTCMFCRRPQTDVAVLKWP